MIVFTAFEMAVNAITRSICTSI